MQNPTSTVTASMAAGQVSSHTLGATDVPLDFNQMLELAEKLAEAGEFLPVKLRKKPHNILALMFHARALNIPLAVAWKELYIAGDGAVSQSARLVRALARRAGHRIAYVEHDRFHAVALIQIKGEPEPHEVRFTIQEAIAMGLTDGGASGKGGKQYDAQPENMMVARVTTRAVTRYCPEVMLGMPDGHDDIGDEPMMPSNDVVSAVRQEHREKVTEILLLAELTFRQDNGAVRLHLLRELFMEARDGLVIDFAADDTGEYSVRNVLVEKMSEANELAKAQAAGKAEPVDPAGGPQTLDDLRSLAQPEPSAEPEQPTEPEPEVKPKRRRAVKKTAAAPEKTQADPAGEGGAPAEAKVPRARKAPAKKAAAAKAAAVAPKVAVITDVQPGPRPAESPAGRSADRPGGQPGTDDRRILPCGCVVDQVISSGKHADTCQDQR